MEQKLNLMTKQKLSIDEQITHMQNKGILFNAVTVDEAKDFISNNTYYFKIKAYAKNYPKNSSLKYVNLEFAALRELSVLDMHLRRIMLSLTLNIEHAIKTDLNLHFCGNGAEDGYAIVEAFRKEHPNDIKANNYTKNLIEKYENNFAIWNYLEVISFGTLSDFYQFYYDIYDSKKKKYYPFLYSSRIVRNISAHNNCFLNNIVNKKTIKPNYLLKNYLSRSKEFSAKQLEKLKIPVLHDFAAVLFAFDLFNRSPGTRKHTYKELHAFVKRVERNISLYDKHLNIKNNLLFFGKLVDFFEKNAYNTSTDQKS